MPGDLDFKSIEVQDKLNQEIWVNQGSRLDPEIRKKLIKIALDFYKELNVPQAKLQDITFTGSLANYNWSKYSDVDLHLIVNYEDVTSNIDLVSNYFGAQKSLWNEKHNITMNGFEVEVYVQDPDEPHTASGLYSVLYDRWIIKPKPGKPIIDKDSVKKKSKFLMTMIGYVKELLDDEEFEEAIEVADRLQRKIRNMRRIGLTRAGEYSSENLAFKLLRRNEYIKKLYAMETEAYDSLMTI